MREHLIYKDNKPIISFSIFAKCCTKYSIEVIFILSYILIIINFFILFKYLQMVLQIFVSGFTNFMEKISLYYTSSLCTRNKMACEEWKRRTHSYLPRNAFLKLHGGPTIIITLFAFITISIAVNQNACKNNAQVHSCCRIFTFLSFFIMTQLIRS